MSNKDPLNVTEYFEEDLDRIKQFIDKNEKFYDEIHGLLNLNQSGGFSLNMNRNTAELAKTLASVRSTALSGVKQLFDAKKSISELSIKQKQVNIENSNSSLDSELVKSIIDKIKYDNSPPITITKTTKQDTSKLDDIINEKLQNNEISLTKNEKAMKYDFIEGGVVKKYDPNKESIVAVQKNTGKIIEDYPIERFGVDSEIIQVDEKNNTVTLKDGSSINFI